MIMTPTVFVFAKSHNRKGQKVKREKGKKKNRALLLPSSPPAPFPLLHEDLKNEKTRLHIPFTLLSFVFR